VSRGCVTGLIRMGSSLGRPDPSTSLRVTGWGSGDRLRNWVHDRSGNRAGCPTIRTEVIASVLLRLRVGILESYAI
jgi:hypothetical protein